MILEKEKNKDEENRVIVAWISIFSLDLILDYQTIGNYYFFIVNYNYKLLALKLLKLLYFEFLKIVVDYHYFSKDYNSSEVKVKLLKCL